jgi:hypothetical protein
MLPGVRLDIIFSLSGRALFTLATLELLGVSCLTQIHCSDAFATPELKKTLDLCIKTPRTAFLKMT